MGDGVKRRKDARTWDLSGFDRVSPVSVPVQIVERVECPQCGSRDVRYENRSGCVLRYHCRSCAPPADHPDGDAPTRFKVIETGRRWPAA